MIGRAGENVAGDRDQVDGDRTAVLEEPRLRRKALGPHPQMEIGAQLEAALCGAFDSAAVSLTSS